MTKNSLIGVLFLYLLTTTERKASSMNHHKVVDRPMMIVLPCVFVGVLVQEYTPVAWGTFLL